jgi:hypothetical protein
VSIFILRIMSYYSVRKYSLFNFVNTHCSFGDLLWYWQGKQLYPSWRYFRRWDCKVILYQAQPRNQGSVPTRSKIFFSFRVVHTGSGAHSASCQMGTRVSFLKGKVARCVTKTTHLPCVLKLQLHGALPGIPYVFVLWQLTLTFYLYSVFPSICT